MTNLVYDRVLLEMDYDQLYNNTVAAFPSTTKRQHISNQVQIVEYQYIPMIPSNCLKVKSETTGEDTTHKQTIIFKGVDFTGDKDLPGHKGVRLQPLSSTVGDIELTCNCSDFYWRFATWNAANSALVGKPPPPYVKKTNRPPANPTSRPGVCKHLIAVIDRVKSDGIVR